MSFKQNLKKRPFVVLAIIGLALVAGCTTDHREADGFFEHVGVVITQCFACIIVLVVFGAMFYYMLKLGRENKINEAERRREIAEHLAKAFLKHGIQKSDFPAIICHCHSCSKIFIVTQTCSMCGTSAGFFSKKRPTDQSFSCSCGWSHGIATCSCGTQNSAVRMGQYVIVHKGISYLSGMRHVF